MGSQSVDFFVSPSGDDRGSGQLDAPFASLGRARDAARGVDSPARVLLRGGYYWLAEPLVLGPEDSGTTFMAYPGEQPIVSGGARITGWTKTTVNEKAAWVAEAPGWAFRQLWVDGGRRQRPRLPKEGFYHIRQSSDCAWYEGTKEFFTKPGDVKQWKNLGDVEMVMLASWVESRMPIVSVDEEAGVVTTGYRSALGPSEGSRYYIENVFEALTEPGNWYCDREAGKLYYLPYPGEEPETTEVIAPRLGNLIVFAGDPDSERFVEQVRMERLTFAHTEWRRSADTPIMHYDLSDMVSKKLIYMASTVDDKASDHLAAVSVPGAITGVGVRNSRFVNCTLMHIGGYGIELGRGCRGNEIAACAFRDLGAGGVKLGTQRVADAAISCENRVVDCDIGPGGFVFHGAVGIWVGQSPRNLVAHNRIHDLFYTGISVGWSMGYDESAAHENIIEGNHIHDLGKAWLSDFGGIYMLGEAPGTRVTHNVIHDLASGEYGACGLYYDEGSCYVVGENNLLYDIAGDAFFMHYGHDNILRNNILARCTKGQLGSSVDVLPHGRIGEHCAVTIEGNIIYLREGEVYRSQWPEHRFVIRRNLVWDANRRPLFCAGRPWQEWQREEYDTESVVADPLFANPERGDFTLAADSPAFAIGFVPFDVSDVGPRVKVGAE